MSVLIITSTVHVNSNLTVLVDPKIRLRQYIDSIEFYLKSSRVNKIIVCDNSGFDYSEINSIVELAIKNDKQVEFLKFIGNISKIQEFGKGFGEGEIMAFVFENSLLIKGYESTFIKVTGRLKITNIDLVLRVLRIDSSYFQPVNLNPFVNLKQLDTRFYQCRKDLFQEVLKESYNNVNDKENFFLEHVYYHKLVENNIKFKRFIFLPNFLGISGSTGIIYSMSNKKFLFRQFIYLISTKFKKR